MLIGGVAFTLFIALLLAVGIFRVSKERISILEVFLGVTEVQIQGFSSKT